MLPLATLKCVVELRLNCGKFGLLSIACGKLSRGLSEAASWQDEESKTPRESLIFSLSSPSIKQLENNRINEQVAGGGFLSTYHPAQ